MFDRLPISGLSCCAQVNCRTLREDVGEDKHRVDVEV